MSTVDKYEKDGENMLWFQYATFFPWNMTDAPQNMQSLQYFSTEFNFFSLNLTGKSESDFIYSIY